MITPEEFVKMFGKENQTQNIESGKKKQTKNIKFGTVVDASGKPRILIEGETTASIKRYPHLSSYKPTIDDKVVILNGTIIGNIGEFRGGDEYPAAQIIELSRSASLNGTQIISGFTGKIKTLLFDATITEKGTVSRGTYARGVQRCITLFENYKSQYTGNVILLGASSVNFIRTDAIVNANNTVTLNWMTTGTAITGTIGVVITALYHGE